MSKKVDCPFCKLDKRIIKQNDLAVVFLDNPRKTAGHFLVSSKRHIEKPWEMTSDELQDIFSLVLSTQQKLVERFSEGCDVRENYKPFIKGDSLVVDHIHYHVLPRSVNDHIYQVSELHDTELYEELTPAEELEMAKVLD